ncbi:putative transposase [Ustilago hordei]|uniref:putative transposase n=1 Tax=Ustilago hordei TaxID=120017 RepID=UPI001A5F79CE|nr:putative transposase [Ustilago hordei]SYW84203.1 probable transposase [Ustilago hordei]
MPKTTPERCQLALFHIQNGESICSVAEQLGMSKSTVNCISKSTSADVPKSKGSQLRKLQPHHVCFLDHYFELNSMSTVRKACHALQEMFQIKACPTTVRKALHYCHYKAQRLVKKLKLLKRHCKACFKFANEHKDMTVEDWKNVVWSNETKINFFGPDGKQFCWIKNSGFNSKLVRPMVKFGSGSIMIWGCMMWEGVGDLQLQHAYTDITFQQDNDLKHMSKKTITWLESNSIKVMQWLAQSLDLNPIEHLWHHLKMQLSQYSTIAKSRDELLKRCEAEWKVITPETCRMLIESMPDHIKVVLKAKGGITKY